MKYVIELDPLLCDPEIGPTLWTAKGFRTLVFDEYGKSRLQPLRDDICIEQIDPTGICLFRFSIGYGHVLLSNGCCQKAQNEHR